MFRKSSKEFRRDGKLANKKFAEIVEQQREIERNCVPCVDLSKDIALARLLDKQFSDDLSKDKGDLARDKNLTELGRQTREKYDGSNKRCMRSSLNRIRGSSEEFAEIEEQQREIERSCLSCRDLSKDEALARLLSKQFSDDLSKDKGDLARDKKHTELVEQQREIDQGSNICLMRSGLLDRARGSSEEFAEIVEQQREIERNSVPCVDLSKDEALACLRNKYIAEIVEEERAIERSCVPCADLSKDEALARLLNKQFNDDLSKDKGDITRGENLTDLFD